MGLDYCQFVYDSLLGISKPEMAPRFWWNLKRLIWHTAVLGPLRFMSKKLGSNEPWFTVAKHAWRFGVFGPSDYRSRTLIPAQVSRTLKGKEPKHSNGGSGKSDLRISSGDWVEVKSFEEIFNTLNEEGKLRGLAFMKEMKQYCGRRFKVFKRLERIILETNGELRRIRLPTFLLEGAFCSGEAHGDCDRSCFCFWREDWLKPVSGPTNETNDSKE